VSGEWKSGAAYNKNAQVEIAGMENTSLESAHYTGLTSGIAKM